MRRLSRFAVDEQGVSERLCDGESFFESLPCSTQSLPHPLDNQKRIAPPVCHDKVDVVRSCFCAVEYRNRSTEHAACGSLGQR